MAQHAPIMGNAKAVMSKFSNIFFSSFQRKHTENVKYVMQISQHKLRI